MRIITLFIPHPTSMVPISPKPVRPRKNTSILCNMYAVMSCLWIRSFSFFVLNHVQPTSSDSLNFVNFIWTPAFTNTIFSQLFDVSAAHRIIRLSYTPSQRWRRRWWRKQSVWFDALGYFLIWFPVKNSMDLIRTCLILNFACRSRSCLFVAAARAIHVIYSLSNANLNSAMLMKPDYIDKLLIIFIFISIIYHMALGSFRPTHTYERSVVLVTHHTLRGRNQLFPSKWWHRLFYTAASPFFIRPNIKKL